MPTLWFSYSSSGGSLDAPAPLNSPYTIWWHVGNALRSDAALWGYNFAYVNLDDTTPREFSPDDVAIGHTWFSGGFMHQALDANIKAKFILQPYSHRMVSDGDVGMVLSLFNKADHLFLITGEHWFDTMCDTPYAPLQVKATRLDMAIDTKLHPFKKTKFNPPGQRAVCVIGNDTPTKGYRHVADLARMAGFRLGHFGSAQPETFEQVPCMVLHGGYLFTPDIIEAICSQYDALIALPVADANPTVLLEAASWGLTVFASRNAGYLPGRPFLTLRDDDPAFNLAQIRAWQNLSEYDLLAQAQAVRRTIEQDYTFDIMCSKIWAKIREVML
jgi:hypothetical protein